MRSKYVAPKVNSNFHHASGEDLFNNKEYDFKEYRQKWHKWPETFYVGEFPLFIDIEVTSACNLKCPFCATTYREKQIKKGFISVDTVMKIIDEGMDNKLYGIKFNIRGEPLLHPRIHDFVKYAKQKKLIDVYFNTNAMLLSEEVASNLIDAGLDRISISVEGYTKEIYEKHRLGAEFDKVLSNIKAIQLLKKKRGVAYPKVRVQTVMLPDLEPIFEDYKKFWSDIADEVAFLDYKMMKEKRKGIAFPWACPQLWQRMAVWWDGTILSCNHDDDGLIELGNLDNVTIYQAWHSEKLNQVRKAHKEGRAHEISACDGCYLRDSQISGISKGA